MVTGGSPNNPMAIARFEKHKQDKLMNPFKTTDASPEASRLKNEANMGPGKYSPQYANDIGGSQFAQMKLKTQTTKQSQADTAAGNAAAVLNLNSNSNASVPKLLSKQSFGSSSARFKGDKEASKVPGPGKYLPHAGSMNIDQRSLDKQWSNKSVSYTHLTLPTICSV